MGTERKESLGGNLLASDEFFSWPARCINEWKHLLANDTRPQAISGAERRQKCELKERESQILKMGNSAESGETKDANTLARPGGNFNQSKDAKCIPASSPPLPSPPGGVPFLFPLPDSVSSSRVPSLNIIAHSYHQAPKLLTIFLRDSDPSSANPQCTKCPCMQNLVLSAGGIMQHSSRVLGDRGEHYPHSTR